MSGWLQKKVPLYRTGLPDRAPRQDGPGMYILPVPSTFAPLNRLICAGASSFARRPRTLRAEHAHHAGLGRSAGGGAEREPGATGGKSADP